MPSAANVPFAELARLGPFFALTPGQPSWQPALDVLLDPAVTDEAIGRYAERLGTVRRDIAGSLLVQGWANRLVSAYAGCAALTGAAPDLAAGNLRYRLAATGPPDFAVDDMELVDVPAAWERLARGHLDPLIGAVQGRCRAGVRRLHGNVAAALAGAVAALARAGVAGAGDLIGRPWARPGELAGLGSWVSTPTGPSYVRRTCCALFRIPGYALCGDCVIRPRAASR